MTLFNVYMFEELWYALYFFFFFCMSPSSGGQRWGFECGVFYLSKEIAFSLPYGPLHIIHSGRAGNTWLAELLDLWYQFHDFLCVYSQLRVI